MLLLLVCLLVLLAHIKLTFINRTLVRAYNEMHRAYQKSIADEENEKVKNVRTSINEPLQKFYALTSDERPRVFTAVKDLVHGHHFELLWRSTTESGPHMAANVQEFLMSAEQDAFEAFCAAVEPVKKTRSEPKKANAKTEVKETLASAPAAPAAEPEAEAPEKTEAEPEAQTEAETQVPEVPQVPVTEPEVPQAPKPKKKKSAKQTVVIN